MFKIRETSQEAEESLGGKDGNPEWNEELTLASRIVYYNGKIVQYMILVLSNVECGKVEIQLGRIEIPGGGRL